MATRLGLEARFFTTPTAILVSFGAESALRTGLIRVEPGELDLGKLAELDRLAVQLIRGERDVDSSSREIDRITTAPPRYSRLLTIVFFALAGASGARLFGGRLQDSLVAGGVSLVIGTMLANAQKTLPITRMLEPLAAFLASFTAVVAARFLGSLSVEVTTLAALFVLLPGLSLTIALTEIATKNLISGSSRLVGSALQFLQLAFGVALGARLGQLAAPGKSPHLEPPELPEWTLVVALVVSTLALIVLFRARRRDVGLSLIAAAISYGGARLGRALVGPELAAFVGALLLGSASNVIARVFDRPAVVSIVPGLMLLVPGTIGFRSLESMRGGNVVARLEGAFSMVLVGVAIVAGLLLANAVVAPRRAL